MLDRIAKGLQTQFDKHRIVFWYDPNREFRGAFEEVELAGQGGWERDRGGHRREGRKGPEGPKEPKRCGDGEGRDKATMGSGEAGEFSGGPVGGEEGQEGGGGVPFAP